jgi:hypothetical protein
MGIFFRKSISLGGISLNFSKSGIGVSIGTNGLRIGTGPQGKYIRAGYAGIYYQKIIKSEKSKKVGLIILAVIIITITLKMLN